MLTVVVPLRVSGNRPWCQRRLRRLLAMLPAGVTALVVDDTANVQDRRAIERLVQGQARARYLHHPESSEAPFSIGRMRDVGTRAADDPFVLFHDLDFTAPPALYRALLTWIQAEGVRDTPQAFCCVPVAFLTRRGTRAYHAMPRLFWGLLSRRREAMPRKLVDRVVLGSSAILAHRDHLIDLGGHDPAFTGHGAEDFELLHRLSLKYPKGPRPADYHQDYGMKHATQGFRGYFGRYGQPLLSEGIVMVHQWHRKWQEDSRYYAQRERNFRILRERMEQVSDGEAFRSKHSGFIEQDVLESSKEF